MKHKNRAVFAAVLAALALLAVPVLAWLYMQRSMETITKINMPNALLIGAGDAKPIQQLELGNIDASETNKSKDVVFCVYSEKPGLSYYLQLAHTTNIGFNYEIYKAELSQDGELSYLGQKYNKVARLEGGYLNKQSGTNYATDKYHTLTYPNSNGSQTGYEHVQQSAEPLYWKSTKMETLPIPKDEADKIPEDEADKDSTGYYVNYYILHISWDKTVINNKETDMIYIMGGQ